MSGLVVHGMRHSSEYNTWRSIKVRCRNENDKDYPQYGGRGIKICDRWFDSFKNFIEDMGPRPTSKHSIDRKDNEGDYIPENCQWATKDVQNNNKRTNLIVEFYGKTKTVSEWSQISLVNEQTIHSRLRLGWPAKLAVWAQPGDVKRIKGILVVMC